MATYTVDKINYNSNKYILQDSGALQLTGGSVTGPVTFGDSVAIDEATVGDIVVNGSASFTNNLQVNTINGVTVGSSPKFTDTPMTVTTTGSGNAVTAVAASGNTITVTKGATYSNNAGTVTGVKINGTTKTPTSGVVDIGTVATSDTNTTYSLSNALSSHKFTSTLTAGGSGSGTSTATMQLAAGTGISLTDDTTNKKITIASTVTNTDTKVTQTPQNGTNSGKNVLLAPSLSIAGNTTAHTEGVLKATYMTYNDSIPCLTLKPSSGTASMELTGISVHFNKNDYQLTLRADTLTAHRNITLPDASGTVALATGIGNDSNGNIVIDNDLYLKGHDSPVGKIESAAWTATSSAGSGVALTGSITLTPGVWIIVVSLPGVSRTHQYYLSNISSPTSKYWSAVSQGTFTCIYTATQDEGVTTQVMSAASTSTTYSNITRGHLEAVRIR